MNNCANLVSDLCLLTVLILLIGLGFLLLSYIFIHMSSIGLVFLLVWSTMFIRKSSMLILYDFL